MGIDIAVDYARAPQLDDLRYPSYPGFSLALVEEFDSPLDLDNASRLTQLLLISFGVGLL